MKAVTKRDGRIDQFNKQKIIVAIQKAFKGADIEYDDKAKEVVDKIAESIEKDPKFDSVEKIQDAIELKLMGTKYKSVAKAYITYRQERNLIRNNNSGLYKNFVSKLMADNVVNQNANVDEHSFGGRKGEANSVMMKYDALYCRMSKMARDNHLNDEIYIHDLDSYSNGMHNCLSVPFDKLLAEGFNTRQTDIRPAQSISTAFQLVAVIFQIQSLNQFGGVSATHIDWTMVPYVRISFNKHYCDGLKYLTDCNNDEINKYKNVDKRNTSVEDKIYEKYPKVKEYAKDMTIKETYQAVEGMYHNLNTLQSRSGNQLPFTSINFGTCTLPEGRLIIKAILDISIKGVGKNHKTSIFPCGIFQYKKEINGDKDSPNHDLYRLALKSTAKRLYPNYLNLDWTNQKKAILDDRNMRKEVLAQMNNQDKIKLVNIIKQNPEIGKRLKLYINNNKLNIDMKEDVCEISSTMGKRKLQLM